MEQRQARTPQAREQRQARRPQSREHRQARRMSKVDVKGHRLGAPTTAEQPKTHKLEDVAAWSIEQLPQDECQKLFAAVQAAKAEGRVLRIGTACSGTDSPVPVFLRLAEALKGLEVEHAFSCKFCEEKQDWIRKNFPDLPCLFKDVKELGIGHAVNVITGEFVAVPKVDILVAGFVCKSASTENNKRDRVHRGNLQWCVCIH